MTLFEDIRTKIRITLKKMENKMEINYFVHLMFNPTAHPVELANTPEYNPLRYNDELGVHVASFRRSFFYITDNRENIDFYDWLMGFKGAYLPQ